MATAIAPTARLIEYPPRKECSQCHRKRSTTPLSADGKRAGKFRRLSSGYLQGMCTDCEKQYERARWHKRSASSRAEAGGTALRRRRAAAAA